jgi:phosphohistidine phosphatase SixA
MAVSVGAGEVDRSSRGAVPRCYTTSAPTKHPRVSVTITPALRAARERLAALGHEPTVGELALVGARQMLREAEEQQREEARRAALRAALVERMTTGEGIDVDALLEVRERGWTRM